MLLRTCTPIPSNILHIPSNILHAHAQTCLVDVAATFANTTGSCTHVSYRYPQTKQGTTRKLRCVNSSHMHVQAPPPRAEVPPGQDCTHIHTQSNMDTHMINTRTCCNSGGSALFGQPGVGGANHRLDPGGQCHCCLAKMSMYHTPPKIYTSLPFKHP